MHWYLSYEGGEVGVFEVVREQVLSEEALVVDLEGSALGVPRDDRQVALLLQHLPCFLDKIRNRVLSHSSKNIIIYP